MNKNWLAFLYSLIFASLYGFFISGMLVSALKIEDGSLNWISWLGGAITMIIFFVKYDK